MPFPLLALIGVGAASTAATVGGSIAQSVVGEKQAKKEAENRLDKEVSGAHLRISTAVNSAARAVRFD